MKDTPSRERGFVNTPLVEPIDKEARSENRQWYRIEKRTAELIAAMLRFSVRIHWKDDRELFNDLAGRFEKVSEREGPAGREIEMELTGLSVDIIQEAWESVNHEFPVEFGAEKTNLGEVDE